MGGFCVRTIHEMKGSVLRLQMLGDPRYVLQVLPPKQEEFDIRQGVVGVYTKTAKLV